MTMRPPEHLLASTPFSSSMSNHAFLSANMDVSWFDDSNDGDNFEATVDDDNQAQVALRALQSFPLDSLLPLSPSTPPRPAPRPPSSTHRRNRPRHMDMRHPERVGLFTVSEVDEPAYEDVFSSTYRLARPRPALQQRRSNYTLGLPAAHLSPRSDPFRPRSADAATLDLPTDVYIGDDNGANAAPATNSPSDVEFNRLSWSSTTSAELPILSRSRSSSGGSAPDTSLDLPQTPERETEDPFAPRTAPVTPVNTNMAARIPSCTPSARRVPHSGSSKASSRRSPPTPLDLLPRSFPPTLPLVALTPTKRSGASTSGGLLPALDIRPAEDWRTARAADAATSPCTPPRPVRSEARPVPGAPRADRRYLVELESAVNDLARSSGDLEEVLSSVTRDLGTELASPAFMFPLPPPRRWSVARDPCSTPPALISPAAESDITIASPRTPTSALTSADMVFAAGPPRPPNAPRRRPPLPALQPPASPLFTSRLARRTYVPVTAANAKSGRLQLRGDHSFLRSLSASHIDLDGNRPITSDSLSHRSESPNSLFTIASNRSVSTATTSIGSACSASSGSDFQLSTPRRALPSRAKLPAAWTV